MDRDRIEGEVEKYWDANGLPVDTRVLEYACEAAEHVAAIAKRRIWKKFVSRQNPNSKPCVKNTKSATQIANWLHVKPMYQAAIRALKDKK
jgi:hypothetical protein